MEGGEGGGVTFLQSSLKKHKSIGCDINAIGIINSESKNDRLDIVVLEIEFEAISQAILSVIHTDIPDIHNIDYWYIPTVIEDLGKIRYVLGHNKYIYKDLFVVCFVYV